MNRRSLRTKSPSCVKLRVDVSLSAHAANADRPRIAVSGAVPSATESRATTGRVRLLAITSWFADRIQGIRFESASVWSRPVFRVRDWGTCADPADAVVAVRYVAVRPDYISPPSLRATFMSQRACCRHGGLGSLPRSASRAKLIRHALRRGNPWRRPNRGARCEREYARRRWPKARQRIFAHARRRESLSHFRWLARGRLGRCAKRHFGVTNIACPRHSGAFDLAVCNVPRRHGEHGEGKLKNLSLCLCASVVNEQPDE